MKEEDTLKYIKSFLNNDNSSLKSSLEDLIKNHERKTHRLNAIIKMSDTQQMQLVKLNEELDDYKNHLKIKVEEKTADIEKQKIKLESLVSMYGKSVIFSKTDLDGIITHASEAFCKICGYTNEELIGKSHNIIRHPDMPASAFKRIWDALKQQQSISAEIKNQKKNGDFYWVESKFEPSYDSSGKHIGYSAVRVDITDKKEVEDLSANLEKKVEEQTKDLRKQKQFVQTLIDSQEQLIITTYNGELDNANETFLDFFAVDTIEEFKETYNAACICDTFNTNAPEGYLQKQMNGTSWIEHLIFNQYYETSKAMISIFDKDWIFSVTASNLPNKEGLKSAVFTNITEMENAKQEIESIHKHTKESIDYASLIQGALIPDNKLFRNYFKDYFVIWNPKDTVGGDIYLFEQLRNEDECLLMIIDCTGHGVPGAFVTMLVKAVEREVVAKIMGDKDIDVSPAWIMSYFNRTLKKLLKQETKEGLSNVGWDGGIIYYNKKAQILKFAGAETPLFYVDTDGTFNTIKGNRYSVGYKRCSMDYEYKETITEVKEGMKFYCTTDGYLDQNGGSKDFPFGKKRFGNIIKEKYTENMIKQQSIFLNEMMIYEDMVENNERNDDMTVVAFEIKQSDIKEIILEYEGVLTRDIISHSINIIEHNISNTDMIDNISTIVTKLTKNMMKYSKSHDMNCKDIRPAGLIEVLKDKNNKYRVRSKNILSIEDKEKIEKIGFYKIAKLAQNIDYKFKAINDEKFIFEFNADIIDQKS